MPCRVCASVALVVATLQAVYADSTNTTSVLPSAPITSSVVAPPPPPTLSPPSPSTLPPSPTLSGCQVCAASGDCSHAYLDGPGQFCGNWLDKLNQRQRCCCPRDAQCKVTNYECKCTKSTTKTYHKTTTHTSSSVGGGVALGIGLVVCCAVGGSCCYRCRQRSEPTRVFFGSSGPMYNVLPTAQQVVYAEPTPMYQPYALGPAYAPSYGYSNGSSWAAGGLGAMAGMATGMMLANSMGHHDHYHVPMNYGDCGGGFSSDNGGDFGGDF